MKRRYRWMLVLTIAMLASLLLSLTAAANPAAPSNPFIGPVRPDDTQVASRPPARTGGPPHPSRLTSPTSRTISAIRSACACWRPDRKPRPPRCP